MITKDMWITNGTDKPFYARKTIQINKEIRSAQAEACGLGQFVFSINGQKVSDHELDPAWTDYRKQIEYVAFDVTNHLHQGINVIGAEIANGWYIMDNHHYSFRFPEFMPPNPNPYVPFGKSLVFAMNLTITYVDGTQETIVSDSSFHVHPHPTLFSNVYGSETFDARMEEKGWLDASFDDSHWKPASPAKDIPCETYIEQFMPPIKVIHTYAASYLHTTNHRRIYDLSQNISGLLSFDVQGKPGTYVKIYPAEKLDAQGDADQVAKGWTTVDTVITYVIGSTETEHYRQKFSYFAGRYLAIETEDPKTILANVQGHAVTSAWKDSGSFVSDDARYDKIYEMIKRTIEANMVSVHTDCPTIERFAWQEPNHLMAPSIFFVKDGRKLWEKFLLDMRMSQHTSSDFFKGYDGSTFPAGDGLVPSQCPCYIPNVLPVPGMGSFYDIIPWGSSIILAAKWHYLFYGDKKILEDNFDAGLRYLHYLKTKMTKEGFINHGLGDWGNPGQELARENIETAFLYADAKTLAQFANILHREEEEELLEFAKEVKDNYNSRLLLKDEQGRHAYFSYEKLPARVKTQACQALPLFWGMVPEEAEADVAKAFQETLEEKGFLCAGEIGLPYIIQTASRYGMNDLISKYITRSEHPSYYAFVKDGMTTLGEYWETNPRSHCHDMMGHILEWYFNGIAGIQIREPGFKKISFQPFMPASMNYFKATVDTPYGTIVVTGTRENNKPVFSFSVPEGIEVL